jgi:predicted membrane protein
MGDVVLDLRGAEVPTGDVEVTATAVMGDVKIYVPDGVDVRLSGIAVMGDKSVRVREAPAGQAAPRVVVKATVVMGDVKVVGDSQVEPSRRTLRAWLSRDDRDRRAIE